MIELTDWTEIEPQNPGTPPWWVLALRIRGETRTTHRRVFAAVDADSSSEPVRVLIAAEFGDGEGEAFTPWEINLRVRKDGVSQYRVIGLTKEELVATAKGPPSTE
jgi:hypothetical protein